MASKRPPHLASRQQRHGCQRPLMVPTTPLAQPGSLQLHKRGLQQQQWIPLRQHRRRQQQGGLLMRQSRLQQHNSLLVRQRMLLLLHWSRLRVELAHRKRRRCCRLTLWPAW